MSVPAPIDTPEQLHDMVAGFHRAWYALRGPDAQLDFMLLVLVDRHVAVIDLSGFEAAIAARLPAASERDLSYMAARFVVDQLKPDAYCLCSEAWMSRATDVMPSEDPERVEVVTTVAVGRLGGQKSSVLRMVRDGATRQVTDLVEEPAFAMSTGDMFHLYGRPTVQ